MPPARKAAAAAAGSTALAERAGSVPADEDDEDDDEGLCAATFMNTPRLWGLDPLLWSPSWLFVSAVLALRPHGDLNDLYFHRSGRPVRIVTVLGTVVALDRREKMIIRHVDDGTGVLACVQWLYPAARVPGDSSDRENRRLRIGELVRCTGHLTDFRGERQVNLSSIARVADPNEQHLWWLQVMKLFKVVYDRPFRPPEDIWRQAIASVRAVDDGEGAAASNAHFRPC